MFEPAITKRSCTRLAVSHLLALRFFGVAFLLLPCLASGCMALNIPSVRYDDPTDRGGWLGPQRRLAPEEIDQIRAGAGSSSCHGCGVDGGADDLEADAPPPPEVPWPRFHPLPTRPVFSPPVEPTP